ncbi:Dihydrolipoyllysine-residue acetyltransferase component of pyruvate dehydrogenase complex [Posidoniimonas polymericola]|uniref:Dihydrolipoamide acetyltransferase component of pyruvate dehydrogenase complex n=1 Tax=Posidoniimonas polymericola TaxID=2528002 RepID=A0A5C5ZE87_9BACT|nr:dihydrolipoamide acetyltransferase family protein [Posidoniimonas polymericola]TWT85466.1 Dihydrolipoyllysine-residue acetyltransferase component of pyruvate dehydrogenase complex [Posidoniimonas polymericola]
MPTEIKLPALGENIDSGDVLSILVSEGDSVDKDQDLLEIETDKATMPVPSPEAGKITKILVSEGDTVEVGMAIFEIEAGGGGAAAAAPAKEEPKPEPKPEPEPEPAPEPAAQESKPDPKPEPEPEPEPAPAAPVAQPVAKATAASNVDLPGDGHSSAAAGPSVRRLARELGVELRRVRPSGEGGRITEDDVRNHVRKESEKANAASASNAPGRLSSDSQGATRVEKMSRMRQTIARNMVVSYTTIPQLTNFDDVDITELEEMRQQSKGDYAKRGLKLSQMPFLVKAIASSLKAHPIVNASVDMENNQVIYKEYVNIGIAVDTDRGLTVPVLRDADRMSISQIARGLDDLVAKARDGKLSLDEMQGGTFTISNMGAVGGTYSTPIINPPEVAIILIGRSRMLPTVVEDGSIEPRLIMPLSLTYDHRVVDGADAARFLNEVKELLAAPGRLLLAP